jgi:glyoxylase-like metal-dependent hydrolase (beta-lactamase superfamily II)
VVTFAQSISLHWNGEEILVVHYPHAHTDGDAVAFFTEANVLHTGDLFFSGVFPFVDLEAGGDVEGLIAAIRDILEDLPPDVKIVPGHGPLSTKEDLRRYLEMLEATRTFVGERRAAGKSLQEI